MIEHNMHSDCGAAGGNSGVFESIAIIKAGQAARAEHGEAYGAQVERLTAEQLCTLQNGGQLAIPIMGGEYILFLEGPALR